MALPSGVVTCTVTYGSAVTFFGDDVQMSLTVTPSHNLVWSATGQPVVAFGRDIAVSSSGTIVLPVVDQAGFVNTAGQPFTMWAYTISIKYTSSSGSSSSTKTIQPLTGQSSIDLDLLPDGGITQAVSGAVAVVTSVNGQTGAVTVTGGSGSSTIAGVSGLQAALDAKAALAHTHTIANVASLQSTLDANATATSSAASAASAAQTTATNAATAAAGKSPLGHTHVYTEVAGVDAAIAAAIAAASWAANSIPVVKRTASFTLSTAEVGRIVDCESTSDIVVTVPTNLAASFADNSAVTLRRTGTGELTVVAGSGVVLRTGGDPAGLRARSQWSSVELSRRPGGAPAFPTANLMERFRADDLTGADLSAVSSWPSAVGGNNAAVQATTANQPKLRTASVFGRNAVEFDGSNDMLSLSGTGLNVARNKSDLMVSICYQMPGAVVTNVRSLYSLSTGTTTGARLSVQQNGTGNFYTASGRRLDADGFASAVATTGSSTGELGILTALYRWSGSDLLLFKNGTQVASNLTFQTSGSTSDTASLTGFIGANATGTAEWFSGKITEIVAYASTDADASLRAAVHSYFVNTYGATSSDYLGASDEWVVSGDTKV